MRSRFPEPFRPLSGELAPCAVCHLPTIYLWDYVPLCWEHGMAAVAKRQSDALVIAAGGEHQQDDADDVGTRPGNA